VLHCNILIFTARAKEAGTRIVSLSLTPLWHARTGAELITRHCADDNDRELAMAAADRVLGAMWSMLDAC
jgi:hypothetical protein